MTATLILSCWLPWFGLWIALFKAPSIPHLVEVLLTKEPMTTDDVEQLLLVNRHYKLLQLYTCAWCQSFWTSVAAGATYLVATGSSLVWLPVFTLSYYSLNTFCVWKMEQLSKH